MKKSQNITRLKYFFYCFSLSVLFFSCKKDMLSSVSANASNDNSSQANNGLVFIMKDQHPGAIYALDANTGGIKWQYTIDSTPATFSPTPCVANNTLFTGVISYGNPEFSNFKTMLWAFNAHTGKLLWSTVLNNALSTITNPTFENGNVYIAAEKKLYSINAANGNINWQKICDSGISDNPLCSPTVINGTIYIGNKQHLFALSAANGSIKWQKKADLTTSSATVSSGFVSFVDHTDGSVKVYDTSGNFKWRFTKAGYLVGSTTTNKEFIYQGIGYPFDTLNSFALRDDNGAVKWNYTQPINTAVTNGKCGDPFYADNTIFFPLEDSLIAISSTGAHSKKWSYFTGLPADSTSFSTSSPVAGKGMVYVINQQKILYALNEINGKLVWKFNTEGENPNYSPVILYDNGTAIHPTGSGMTQ